ncbi:hypothetical protein F2Q69_00036160 [Brassica cretica]|uniref:Uncharacterized protein n=1 Tax=Brassica cretica TaxID=69181 RepID=A0A8S9SQF5_BRACR|nr:hypothetical protein F2Q69_00036160 [Brassica cretica]
MEDFLELEEFLELEDGEQLGDLDSSREVTMEDFFELEEWLEDIDQIWIWIQHRQPVTDQQHPPDIDRCPLLEEPPGCIVEMAPIEERMHKSEVSHFTIHEHLRPPICVEEATGFHKRVKRIHYPVKIVVPCAVSEVEFPIPPDKVCIWVLTLGYLMILYMQKLLRDG